MFVDKDQSTKRSELCWSLLSTLLARCRYRGIGAPKISLVNEVQCGTGTKWSDLIGQQRCYGAAIRILVKCSTHTHLRTPSWTLSNSSNSYWLSHICT